MINDVGINDDDGQCKDGETENGRKKDRQVERKERKTE